VRARQVSTREDFTGPAHLAAHVMLTGYALRTWRVRKGLTLAQMGLLLGCTDGHLSRVERGVRVGPTPAHIAAALGMTEEEFLAPCGGCGWNPPEGTVCPGCGTAQSAVRLAEEIVSWLLRGGS
jgi:transcriptional regulator with XRE-family HTH domain